MCDCVVKHRWVQGVRDQQQPHAGASGSSLISPADLQQRRRQRQFVDWQPRPYRFSIHSTTDVDMDVLRMNGRTDARTHARTRT